MHEMWKMQRYAFHRSKNSKILVGRSELKEIAIKRQSFYRFYFFLKFYLCQYVPCLLLVLLLCYGTEVFQVSFLWRLLEPYKFLTTKKIRYGRAYGTIFTERDVKSISVKVSAFFDEFF